MASTFASFFRFRSTVTTFEATIHISWIHMYQKCIFGRRSNPESPDHAEELTAFPRPLNGVKGPLCEERKRSGKSNEKREGRRKSKEGEEGKVTDVRTGTHLKEFY